MDDQWWADGPEIDEDGYELETDENGDLVLDENDNPVRTGISGMQDNGYAVDTSVWTGYGRVLM